MSKCMMKKESLLIALLLPGLVSCDPVHVLLIKNRSGQPAHFTYEISRANQPDTLITRTLKTEKENRHTGFFYGFGVWDKTALDALSKEFKYLHVVSHSDTITLREQTKIRDFFARRRRGIFKNYIVINIK